jgi:hypothetical protein
MRKTKTIAEKPVIDLFGHWVRKPFLVGQMVSTISEVNGMPRGTRAQIVEVQHDGAAFRVTVLNGPKSGSTLRIKASDLNPS